MLESLSMIGVVSSQYSVFVLLYVVLYVSPSRSSVIVGVVPNPNTNP